MSSNRAKGEVYSIQHYAIMQFVGDLRHAGRWFSPVSSTNQTDRHDITEILLKVALNFITLTLTPGIHGFQYINKSRSCLQVSTIRLCKTNL